MGFRKISQLEFSQIYDAIYERMIDRIGSERADHVWDSLGDTLGKNMSLTKGTITSAMRLQVSLVRFRDTGTTHRLTDYTGRSRHNWRSLLERRVHWSSVTQSDGYHWQITT